MPLKIRAIKPDELASWFEASATAFYIWQLEPSAIAEARRDSMEIERVIGAFEGDAIVGTFRTFEAQLTLPGGARVPVSSVTGVTVRPTHRRAGILGRLMADDVRRATKAKAVAGVLIASEWPIYGRFGYGPATWAARWTLRVRSAAFRVAPVGSVEIVSPLAARQVVPDVYDAYAARQPGELSRPQDQRWDYELGLFDMPGRPRWRGSVAIHRDEAGNPDGYARYHGEEIWDDGIPDNLLHVDELHGVTPAAELDLWRFLAQMDLTATLRAETRREHEPLPWYLADARAARVSHVNEFIWLRPFDVERLLGERSYERDGELVLEILDVVDDKPGPAAGRYRLDVRSGSATCRRTDAAPDLTLDARSLGAISLGGTRLVDVTRAGGATEHRAGALAAADLLFRTAEPPWCTTWF